MTRHALNLYLNWASSMIIGHMRNADGILDAYETEVRDAAAWFFARVRPWGDSDERELFRGLRLAGESLDGTTLTPGPYADVRAVSFSEDLDVACHFADPGRCGFPAVDLTGRRTLPPTGYVAFAQVPSDRVLFHHAYFAAVPDVWSNVFAAQGGFDWRDAVAQSEVTVWSPGLAQNLRDFRAVCASYIERRYGPGGWEPGDPDPFGPSMFGTRV